MRITLEATDRVITINGQRARVWEGATADGVPLTAFIVRVAVDEAHDSEAFARDLLECPAPRVAWPAVMFDASEVVPEEDDPPSDLTTDELDF